MYSITSDDKYSDFDSSKSFNRVNTPETEQLFSHHHPNPPDPDSTIVGVPHDVDSTFNKNTYEGIHETRLAWRHISNWLSQQAQDLKSLLQSPCTDSDLLEFQKDLGIKLPNCVIEFYKLTDGQSPYNNDGTGGLIFGLNLLPLEEIVVLTENWRKVADTLQTELSQISQSQKVSELSKVASIHNDHHHASMKKFSSSSSTVDLFDQRLNFLSSHIASPGNTSLSSTPLSTIEGYPLSSNSISSFVPTKKSVSNTQRSIPPGRIHSCYAHHMWIPIITDGVGNCIGIDLAPVVKQDWGQVILFGRNFDTKFRIADNFGDFLLLFANDLEKGNWELKNNESQRLGGDLVVGTDEELVYISEELGSKIEVPYLEILKRRSLQAWVDSLGKEQDLDPELKELILNIRNESKSTLSSLTWKQLSSTDQFINRHLTLIDKINVPINTKTFIPPPPPTSSASKGSSLKIDTTSDANRTAEIIDTHIVPLEIVEESDENEELEGGLHNIPI